MDRVTQALRRLPMPVVYAMGAVPAAVLILQAVTNRLGVDPVKALEHGFGLHALQFLVAGLAITPLRRWAGLNLLRFRRAFGLLAFGYAALHLAVWLFLDLQLRWTEIGADLTRRPYVMIGMAAFALMVPLAVTSNNRMVRKLGATAWNRLHRLTYVVVFAGSVHFVMVAKTWQTESLAYLALTLALLAARVVPRRQRTPSPGNGTAQI